MHSKKRKKVLKKGVGPKGLRGIWNTGEFEIGAIHGGSQPPHLREVNEEGPYGECDFGGPLPKKKKESHQPIVQKNGEMGKTSAAKQLCGVKKRKKGVGDSGPKNQSIARVGRIRGVSTSVEFKRKG